MEVSEFSLWEYMFSEEKMRTSLSDYYMKTVPSGQGEAFALRDGERVVSYAIFRIVKDTRALLYLFTDPDLRRRGHASALLQNIIQNKKERFLVSLNEGLSCYDALCACLEKLEFRQVFTGQIFHLKVDETLKDKMEARKLPAMKNLLLRDRGECISLRDLSPLLRTQLEESKTNEFQNSLNPALLLRGRHNIDEDLSMVMLRDGKLCSYALVSRPSEDMVCVEEISEAGSDIGAGTVIAPVCCVGEKIQNIPEIRKITMCIRDDNTESKEFFFSLLKGEDIRAVKTVCYCRESALPEDL